MKENDLYDDFKMKLQNETKKKLLYPLFRRNETNFLSDEILASYFMIEGEIDYQKMHSVSKGIIFNNDKRTNIVKYKISYALFYSMTFQFSKEEIIDEIRKRHYETIDIFKSRSVYYKRFSKVNEVVFEILNDRIVPSLGFLNSVGFSNVQQLKNYLVKQLIINNKQYKNAVLKGWELINK